MSDANLASIAFTSENTLGTALGQLQELRFTKESLGFEKESVTSAQIRSDRQVSDSQKVFGQPSGGFEFELSYAFILPWLAAALQAIWLDIIVDTSITTDAGDQTLTGSAGTFDFVPVGAAIKISGCTTEGSNGIKRVIAKSEDGSTLTLAAESLVTPDETTALTITGKTIRNGTERKSFSLEKRLINNDSADFYQNYKGMVVDTLTLNIESKNLITGSVGMLGTNYQLTSTGIDVGSIASETATGTLTLSDTVTPGETVTIGDRTYTFRAVADEADEVDTGANENDAAANLAAAINLDAGEGTLYGTGTVLNPWVTALAVGPLVVLQAIRPGAIGNAIVTTVTMTEGSFGSATLAGGVTQSSGYSVADTGPVMNGSNNIGQISLDEYNASEKFKSIKLEISNNVRGKDACGNSGNFDIGLGQFQLKGSMNAYFRDNGLLTRIKDHTSFSFEFYVEDASGNRLYFYAPHTKLMGGNPGITGVNTDVMLDASFESSYGGNATGATLIIDAFPV
jgi:hypothetical protein